MTIRIVADDLTGALDSAVQFTARAGPIPVFLRAPPAAEGNGALDTASRERPLAEAIERASLGAAFLAGADIAFRKIDSQMRGHWPAELKATLDSGFASCVLAPAYPAQGRVTRSGRQWLRGPSRELRPLGPDIQAALAEAGIGRPAFRGTQAAGAGVVRVFDAESDGDLRQVVAEARAMPKPVLWCGSAGLAAALGGGARRIDLSDAPSLAIVGSHHPASLAQVERALAGLPPRANVAVTAEGDYGTGIETALGAHGVALVTFPFAGVTEPAAAAAEIRRRLARMIAALRPPPLLFATGGETLRAIGEIIGATSFVVDGEIEPGVPVSTIGGGAWAGVRVISKSGGFGDEAFLARLFSRPHAHMPSPG